MADRFVIRPNKNGTFDAICATCYLTVATAKSESALAAWEEAHRCDPSRLEMLERDKAGQQLSYQKTG